MIGARNESRRPWKKFLNVVKRFDNNKDWLFANWLWKLRAALEGKQSDFRFGFSEREHYFVSLRTTLPAKAGWNGAWKKVC
ncbi:MAG: hypothetical protein IPJ47_22765 [Anaerolineales bacterium]|nr:hypothetical protein [Anaerolineales bacterium]